MLGEPLVDAFFMVSVQALKGFQILLFFERHEADDAFAGIFSRVAVELVDASDRVDLLGGQPGRDFALGLKAEYRVVVDGFLLSDRGFGGFLRRVVPAQTWRFIVLCR